MFDRKEFKKNALLCLKKRWKVPVLSMLLIFALSVVINIIITGSHDIVDVVKKSSTHGIDFSVTTNSGLFSGGLLITLVLLCIVGAFFLSFLVTLNRLYLTTEQIKFNEFIHGFEQWSQGVRGTLWNYLWVFLWSCLFVIPGIVKAYSYSMMFLIMAENPNMGVTKAMNLSKTMTRGYKGELFIMDLSFFGWFLICLITCGVGFLWLFPYMFMAKTNSYHYLKDVAIKTSVLSKEDFA